MNDKEKLLRDYARMCKEDCKKCQIKQKCRDLSCNKWIEEHTKEAVEIIEKWAAEHPVKTRQSEFLKLHPNAILDSDGVLEIAPCVIDSTLRFFRDGICTRGNDCIKCAREYWSQEVTDE